MNNNPFIAMGDAAKNIQLQLGSYKIALNDLPEEAWEYILGGPDAAPDLRKYFQRVAWLNRAVKLRRNHVQAMPFKIYRGESIVDESKDYQNVLMFLPNIKNMLGMIEQGLTMNGREYQFIERSAILGSAVATGMRHMVASSIKPKITREGLQYFERHINGVTEKLELDQVLYFWYPDDSVEIGEPHDWPALAALQAAGILSSVGNFAQMFFDRGAIKVTLLTTKGNVVEAERNRLKAWWDRLRGKAWATEIVNADAVEVVPVGEGLESLDNKEFTTEQREDISTALGVPHSMLFSNAANYATSQQDKMNFYEDTIIPECDFIGGVMNEQLLEPLGYRIVFDAQELPIFQEDEEQRSASFFNYVNATIRPSIAAEILGLEMPDGIEYEALDEKFDQDNALREKQAEAQLERAKNPAPVVNQQAPPGSTQTNPPDKPEKASVIDELAKWERKALKRIQRGYDPACSFESEAIPLITLAFIEGALESTTNKPELVRALFADAWVGYP